MKVKLIIFIIFGLVVGLLLYKGVNYCRINLDKSSPELIQPIKYPCGKISEIITNLGFKPITTYHE